MKRKQIEYEKAIALRKTGKSIKKIAKLLGVSVSIVAVWSKEVKLTEKQKENLKRRKVRVRHLRRLARRSHLEKVLRVKKILKEAIAEIKSLSEQELFLTGLALYWAEGFKSVKEGRLGFCNSDPKMIKFIIKWFEKALKVKREDFILRTEFNETHKDRTEKIKSFWVKLTGIPLGQFEKPFYHRSTWLRDYSNRGDYYGILRVRVRRSSELLNKTRGWISGLSRAI
ncbi:MAG: hypothetical protein Q8P92_04020 [Candidatus Daviesbacteria bacterium]|nr:hypothetical protein [Candidatus Daviesbacteria bacterium]